MSETKDTEQNEGAVQSQGQEYEFTAEVKQLLNILVHSLYSQREIFLRELISNASDALDKIRFRMLTEENVLGKDQKLEVHIDWDKDQGTLSIEDSGIGMTKEDIVENIGVIAHSGTKSFLQSLGKEKQTDINLIGQFGVGFYSVFMVADKVTLETRSYHPDSQGYRWESEGVGNYTISEIPREKRGTKITLHMKEEDQKFLEEWRLKDIVQRYSDFVPYPIYLKESQANRLAAIWTRSRSEVTKEEYHEFYKYLTHTQEEPLDYIHLSYDAPIQFFSIIYIPRSIPVDMRFQMPEKWKGVHLYAKRVFIKADCEELLPQYLHFARGIVDSDDLNLNISRETLQENQIITKISKNLTKKILEILTAMAEERTEDYELFWNNFGKFFKHGYRTDFANRDKIAELLRFNSSFCEKESGLVSLKGYVSRMPEGQKEIYYLSGESRDIIEKNPTLEIFQRKGVEVIYCLDPLDDLLFEDLKEYDEKKIINAAAEDISLADLEDVKDKEEEKKAEEETQEEVPEVTVKAFDDLLGYLKDKLKERVTDVKESKRLVKSPCCLVSAKDAMGVGMQRVMKMMDEKYEMAKRILEINRKHPLIQRMAKIYEQNPREALLEVYSHHLVDTALVMEGAEIDPRETSLRMQKLMEHSAGMLANHLGSQGEEQQ